MGVATAVTAGIGAATSAAQMFSGAKKRKEAERALDNYQRQEFSNVADDLSVYTRGAEMQMDESSRLGSSSIDALSRGGSRNIIGGIGRLNQSQQIQQRQIASDLERQQARIDQIRAQDAQNIRNLQEQRETQDISALSSQYQQGENMLWSGVGGLAQTGIGVGGLLSEDDRQKEYLEAMYGNSQNKTNGSRK